MIIETSQWKLAIEVQPAGWRFPAGITWLAGWLWSPQNRVTTDLRAWVDGRPAFEKTDLRFRTVDRLKIEKVWMNVYHGGTQQVDRDVHLQIDNVVISRQYVGPMAKKP